MTGVDLGAHGFFEFGIGRQSRRAGRMHGQPCGQHGLSPVNGGPDGP
eukprot:gene16497-18824_t